MRLSKRFRSIFTDPQYEILKRAEEDPRVLRAVTFLEAGAWAELGVGPDPIAADGINYRDTREPIIMASQTAITLAATDKILYPGNMTALVANYLGKPGKKIKLTVNGAMTTGATPGNLGLELYYGTADAATTLLASSSAPALTASRTSMSCVIEAYLRSQGGGATPTTTAVYAWAKATFGQASTNDLLATPTILVPASVPATVNVDSTLAGGFCAQIKRSGSTAETFTTWDLIFEALT
jgi:hypothetical protein